MLPSSEKIQYRIVRKSNKLVNSRNSFTVTQNKILLLMLAELHESDYDIQWIDIPIQKVIDPKENKSPKGAQYQQVKEAALGMSNSAIYIKNENGKWKSIPLIQAEGDDQDSSVRVKFMDVKESVDVLKNIFEKHGHGYTSYILEIGMSFRKKYTLRIYEKLKRACNQSPSKTQSVVCKVNIKELREELNLDKNKSYDKIFEFKRRVIEPAVQEINELSDLMVDEYDTDKKRKATAFIFTVSYNAAAKDFLEPRENAVEDVEYEEVPEPGMLVKLKEQFGEDYVRFAEKKLSSRKDIKNKTGYLVKALKDGYFKEEFEESLKEAVRHKKAEAEQKSRQLVHEKKEAIQAEFSKVYGQLIERYRKRVTPMDIEAFIQANTDTSQPLLKKYIQEFKKEEASHLAWVSLLSWYIRHHGEARDRELMTIEGYAQLKYGMDWNDL